MAKLFKRGKIWNVTYYQAGKRHRKSLGKDRKRAEAAFKEIAYRLSKNDLIHTCKIPFSLFVEEFLEYAKARLSDKTHHNYSIALNHLETYLNEKEGVKYLQDVYMGMIDRFVASRLKAPSPQRKGGTVERSTVNTELKGIKRFFNRAVELCYLKESPAKKVKLLTTARKNPRFFSEEEVALILGDCKDERVREIYLVLLYTGMRIGELVNLEWDDVDLVRRTIAIRSKAFWKPKGNEERLIPMHDVVFYILFSKARKSRWALAKADGEKNKIHSLETRFRRQLKRLRIPDATLHTWRHTFASYLTMRTGNIRAVQKLLGHKSIRTTEIYSHLSDRHLHGVVGQLPGPEMGAFLGAPAVLPGRGIVQIPDNKVVGDTGFEPVTPTV
jgi:site-specific recombinase XerD